ncbi:uncharacterized protein LOC128295951 [Gossypium arboreum]|uniref:uncharacterized protein LOC128295951 n=1 Tax=Gossypium arboreum TaxID=29729 RepID=UPI0022F16813|nr:uncharacterized protein LOC128295951 [Gossypium arboreum]
MDKLIPRAPYKPQGTAKHPALLLSSFFKKPVYRRSVLRKRLKVLLSTLGNRHAPLRQEESVRSFEQFPIERDPSPSANSSTKPILEKALCCPNAPPGKRRCRIPIFLPFNRSKPLSMHLRCLAEARLQRTSTNK